MESITENNKLLAEFMGAEIVKIDGYYNIINWNNPKDCPKKKIGSLPTTMFGTEEETLQRQYKHLLNENFGRWGQFHKDWNHLMLVVDKISETDFIDDFEIKKCSIFGNTVKITPSKKDTFDSFYFDSTKENLIEVVHNS